MMIGDLKRALENNKLEEIKQIQNECKVAIKKKMEDVGSNFKIKRYPFCEANNLTDRIREKRIENQAWLLQEGKIKYFDHI